VDPVPDPLLLKKSDLIITIIIKIQRDGYQNTGEMGAAATL
jgi:hypothetical protein